MNRGAVSSALQGRQTFVLKAVHALSTMGPGPGAVPGFVPNCWVLGLGAYAVKLHNLPVAGCCGAWTPLAGQDFIPQLTPRPAPWGLAAGSCLVLPCIPLQAGFTEPNSLCQIFPLRGLGPLCPSFLCGATGEKVDHLQSTAYQCFPSIHEPLQRRMAPAEQHPTHSCHSSQQCCMLLWELDHLAAQ